MIYTVTLNPALDYFVSVESFKTSEVNRSKADHKAPGGKGINVSRVLKHMGQPSVALGFIGGFTGEYIKSTVQQEEIQTDFIQVEGDTRINVKIKSDVESELNGVSPNISSDNVRDLEKKFEKMVHGDTVILSGSVPNSLPPTVYQHWTSLLKKRGVEVFIDTSGQPLVEAIQAKPTFIKPNHHELSELVGDSIQTFEHAVPHVQSLIDSGIDYVLLTFAGDGALLATKEQILTANTPNGIVKNSIGAGDSTVAGFVSAQKEGMELADAFRFAIATGSATAFSTGLATRSKVESLLADIQITAYKQ
ncbi:phosphofructokinase [Alkalihalobacillus alcalophilus ATCC 27647 = CGMCC 1.3604]|uniref:Tagatose-6-phosphate kinase n=1 Tax=Alkalihalobacillus alcalophilus ATCC 27647 = CGMCC 1.3604 TaxID=1218173 RepID=A0A094WML7_ALKAL|nr:1-phosphofructokinase [Alkalihalobacillus alcalophilus]KGA99009.1 phosphofructokinase [Alkalihalobacillus alcalophilus ATCC 27647 = CGMCC 1.3604]MED1560647.1 1-phosphofructokinase [Alkalihalobacillus alcalophilus]THG89664.1 phosphofructokinase [Alkalihalobacillus alcalophilus ATCC 27647 = CGMCC 1.3604]